MARLQQYNSWLHDRFDAYLGRRMLEVGSGVGNQTRYFADRDRVVASDIEPHYVRELQSKFEQTATVRVASFQFPLTEANREDLRAERIDTIVCLNVLEHIEDHDEHAEGLRRHPAGGRPSGPARAVACRRSTARSTST